MTAHNLLKAAEALTEAGLGSQRRQARRTQEGEQLSIEFLLRQPTMERVIGPMRKNLERLGIASSIRMVDDSQYQKRTDAYDFDVVSIWINRGAVLSRQRAGGAVAFLAGRYQGRQ